MNSLICMKLMRLRKFGPERVLGVPREIAKKLSVEYMDVQMDDDGRLIYTPVKGGA